MEERRERLMQVQQKIAFDYNESQVGKTIDVMIDVPVEDHPGAWVGRAMADAPDVDSVVFVTETEPLKPGTLVETEIVGYQGYDLIGVATGTPK